MTPEEAILQRDLLLSRGHVDDYPKLLALETIANLTWEWRVESVKGADFSSSSWVNEKEARAIFEKNKSGLIARGVDPADYIRLVRRLVADPEVIEP